MLDYVKLIIDAIDNKTTIIKNWSGVTIEYKNSKFDIMYYIKKVNTSGKGNSVIYLKMLKLGVMLEGEKTSYIINNLKIDSKGNITYAGLSFTADQEFLDQWNSLFNTNFIYLDPYR
jgi:hypothetical protein